MSIAQPTLNVILEYGSYSSFIALIILLIYKIFPILSHIDEFRERKNKSKGKKIEQALKSPNLSETVKVYLQDKLISEYFYRATGISASPNNIGKIIDIHNGDNDIKDFHFKRASDYANYQDLDIEINLNKFDKFNYYINIISSWFFGLAWVFNFFVIYLLIFTNIVTLSGQTHIQLLAIFVLFPILFIFMFKDVLTYRSARKIQQHLKSRNKER